MYTARVCVCGYYHVMHPQMNVIDIVRHARVIILYITILPRAMTPRHPDRIVVALLSHV